MCIFRSWILQSCIFRSCIFQSRIFQPCYLVHQIPILHFPPPAFRWSVIFQSCIFSRPRLFRPRWGDNSKILSRLQMLLIILALARLSRRPFLSFFRVPCHHRRCWRPCYARALCPLKPWWAVLGSRYVSINMYSNYPDILVFDVPSLFSPQLFQSPLNSKGQLTIVFISIRCTPADLNTYKLLFFAFRDILSILRKKTNYPPTYSSSFLRPYKVQIYVLGAGDDHSCRYIKHQRFRRHDLDTPDIYTAVTVTTITMIPQNAVSNRHVELAWA